MTATTTEPKHQTWVDWMPPGTPEPFLFTRDELIQELADEGIEVNYRNLEHWQLKGVIPYPVRRRHEGATRAMYPDWIIGAIKHLRDAQDRGMGLDKIAPLMRMYAFRDVKFVDPLAKPLAEARAAVMAFVRAWERMNPSGPKVGGVEIVLTDGLGNDDSELDSFGFPVLPEEQ